MQKAFIMFIKYGGSTQNETSISLLIRFDAIISSFVNSFATTLGFKMNDENLVDK